MNPILNAHCLMKNHHPPAPTIQQLSHHVEPGPEVVPPPQVLPQVRMHAGIGGAPAEAGAWPLGQHAAGGLIREAARETKVQQLPGACAGMRLRGKNMGNCVWGRLWGLCLCSP